MKKKLGVILSFIMLAVCSVFFVPNLSAKKSYAADTDIQYKSEYLYDGTNAYLSNVIAGYADGYGTYTKGQKAELSATAQNGFELVGWRIEYKDNGSVQFVNIDGTTSSYKSAEADYETNYKMTYALTYEDKVNADGKNDFGTFVIDVAKVDMVINPVFSYIYYNVKLDNVAELKLENEEAIGANRFLYYTQAGTYNDEITYQNAVIKIDEDYYYYGELKYKDGNYYTTKSKNQASGTGSINIDYNLGAFRFGEEVNVDLNLNNYIDVTGAEITNGLKINSLVQTEDALDVNEYKLTKNGVNKNSENIIAKFAIEQNYLTGLETIFRVNYDKLYLITLDFRIDGEVLADNYLVTESKLTEPDLKELLINNTEMINTFGAFNGKSDVYLVKTNSAYIKCNEKIYDENDKYLYYEFSNVEGYGDNPAQLNNLTADKTLVINYSSIEYNVEFRYVLQDGTDLKTINSFVLPATSQNKVLKRGQKVTLTAGDIHNSTGFEYIETRIKDSYDLQDLESGDLDVAINLNQPQDQVVIMIYSYIEYSVSVAQIVEDFKLKGAYPLLNATLKIERGDNKVETTLGYEKVLVKDQADYDTYFEIVDNVMTKSSEIVGNSYNVDKIYYINKVYNNNFNYTIHIGDRIRLIAEVTNPQAFTYDGFKFEKVGGNTFNEFVTFDAQAINLYAPSNELVIYAREAYKTYSLIYKTDYKTIEDESLLLATIGVNPTALTLTYEYYLQVKDNKEEELDTYYEIDSKELKKASTYVSTNIYYTETDNASTYSLMVIKGIRFDDSVTLNATGNIYDKDKDGIIESPDDYYFVFINFEKNNLRFKADSTTGNPAKSIITTTIKGNEVITVNYSQPTTTLNISLNNENAMNSGLYTVEYFNGVNYVYFGSNPEDEYYVEDDTYYTPTDAKIRISIVKSKIKFGYKPNALNAMKVTKRYDDGKNQSSTTSALPNLEDDKYNFILEFDGKWQYVAELNFDLIDYRITLLQNGAGYEDVEYDFNPVVPGVQTLSLNVENLQANFEIPQYYYVSEIKVPTRPSNNGHMNIDQLLGMFGITNKLSQSNTDVAYNYSLDFTDKLMAFKLLAGNGEEFTDYVSLKIYIQYVRHTTDIDIMYNLDGTKVINEMIFDQFPLLLGSDDAIVKEYITTEKGQKIGIRFKDVQFGNTFNVDIAALMEGIEYKDGTIDAKTISFENIGDVWTADNNKDGRNVITDVTTLDLLLTKYDIDLNMSYLGERSTQLVDGEIFTIDNNEIIAEPEYEQATLYSNIGLSSNANQSNGIKFKSMYYFSRFIGNEEEFNLCYDKLYIYNGSEFVENTNETYDDSIVYYNKVVVNDSSFSLEFVPARFGAIDKSIKVFVEYTDYLFSLLYSAEENGGSQSLNFDPINLTPDKYAEYEVKVNGEVKEKIKFNDTVILSINLKTVPYRLVNGLSLDKVMLDTYTPTLFKNFIEVDVDEFTTGVEYFKIIDTEMVKATEVTPVADQSYYVVAEGSYIVMFKVDSAVANLVMDDYLLTYLTYDVVKKEIDVITNITDSSFFTGKDRLLLKFMDQSGDVSNTDPGYSIEYKNATFLGESQITFEFNEGSNFKKYFEIKDFNIKYYENAVDYILVPESQYEAYGIRELISIEDGREVFYGIACRHIVKGKVVVEFIVTPIITLHEDKTDTNPDLYVFTKEYKETNWIGQPNALTIGETNSFDIETAPIVSGQMIITYKVFGNNFPLGTDPVDAGRYTVEISFKPDSWWQYISVDYDIELVITKKQISLYYNTSVVKLEKTYDGTTGINDGNTNTNKTVLLNNLCVMKDLKSFNLAQTSIDIDKTMLTFEIGTGNVDDFTRAYKVSTEPYKIMVSGIVFKGGTDFNKNYTLSSDKFVTEAIMQINPRKITISGLKIYDKVFDGEKTARYYFENGAYELNGILDQDKDLTLFEINFDDAIFEFKENHQVGYNRRVAVDLSGAIKGEMSDCYNVIAPTDLIANIYPYSIEAELDGFGTVKIINKRGLEDCTNQEMVRLIPIDAALNNPKLLIKEIGYETEKYFDIYKIIANFMRGKKYQTAFSLTISANNTDTALSNNLYLSLPVTNSSQTVLFATASAAGKLNMQADNGEYLIDLSSNTEALKAIVVLKDRTYMKGWQIALIVVSITVVVGAALTTFFVLRSKKKKQYKNKDTI